MWRGVVAGSAVVLVSLGVTTSAVADEDRVGECMSPNGAHELLVQQKLVPPVRALREAVHAGQGEAVGVELCRVGDAYVYDVTLLHHDGRVSHVLINARTGSLATARPK